MKHPMRVMTCVVGLAVALLMFGGCGQDSPGSGQENEQPPVTPGDGQADQKSGDNVDTHLPSDRILKMLGVDLARIDLAEPTAISIFAEFGEERRMLLDGPVYDGALQVAVLVDSDPDRIRIAVASAEGNAAMTTLKENPFRDTGSAFNPTPSDDGEGKYTIMESSPPDAIHRIVIVTRPATPE